MVTEKHLYLALEAYNHSEEGTALSELALESILSYAQENVSEDKVPPYAQELIFQHTLNSMISEGLLEVDLDGDEIVYGLSEAEQNRLE